MESSLFLSKGFEQGSVKILIDHILKDHPNYCVSL